MDNGRAHHSLIQVVSLSGSPPVDGHDDTTEVSLQRVTIHPAPRCVTSCPHLETANSAVPADADVFNSSAARQKHRRPSVNSVGTADFNQLSTSGSNGHRSAMDTWSANLSSNGSGGSSGSGGRRYSRRFSCSPRSECPELLVTRHGQRQRLSDPTTGGRHVAPSALDGVPRPVAPPITAVTVAAPPVVADPVSDECLEIEELVMPSSEHTDSELLRARARCRPESVSPVAAELAGETALVADRLYLGTLRAAQSPGLLCQLRVSAVVDVSGVSAEQTTSSSGTAAEANSGASTGAPPPCVCRRPQFHRQHRLRVELLDNSEQLLQPYLQQLNSFISAHRRLTGAVLVHSQLGRSRAPAVVLQHLMLVEKFTLAAARQRLARCWPPARPNPGFLRQLQLLDRGREPAADGQEGTERGRQEGAERGRQIQRKMLAPDGKSYSFKAVKQAWC